jgi:hypothetical protein
MVWWSSSSLSATFLPLVPLSPSSPSCIPLFVLYIPISLPLSTPSSTSPLFLLYVLACLQNRNIVPNQARQLDPLVPLNPHNKGETRLIYPFTITLPHLQSLPKNKHTLYIASQITQTSTTAIEIPTVGPACVKLDKRPSTGTKGQTSAHCK